MVLALLTQVQGLARIVSYRDGYRWLVGLKDGDDPLGMQFEVVNIPTRNGQLAERCFSLCQSQLNLGLVSVGNKGILAVVEVVPQEEGTRC